ncbi:PREDICTED: uncharacterized protein LOC108375965, partial [Rhagoletis zephyria]|uniref:uncharacterized protein LOC108375965 n=1 Tax=Rhagoletis zephyria TaxID=28612 RepID=UPI0008115C03
MSTTMQQQQQPSPNDADTSPSIHIFNHPNSHNANNTNIKNDAANLAITANVILVGGDNIVANGTCATEQSQQAGQTLIINSQQLLHEQQDIPATDSGRASVNEFDTTLEESLPATVLEITAADDSGSGATAIATAANSKDMEIPATIVAVVAGDVQPKSKKHCSTTDFYASSGSQTKWYLPPMEICADTASYIVTSAQPSVAVNNVVIISTSGGTETSQFSPKPTTGDAGAVVVSSHVADET